MVESGRRAIKTGGRWRQFHNANRGSRPENLLSEHARPVHRRAMLRVLHNLTKGKIMKFIHHNTGDWIRSACNTSAERTGSYVNEYESIDAIPDQWIRENFEFMLAIGEIVISTGSDVFQIRA